MYRISETTTALLELIRDGFPDAKVMRGNPEKMKLFNLGVPYLVVQEKKQVPDDTDLGAMKRSMHTCSFVVHVFLQNRDPETGLSALVTQIEDLVHLLRRNLTLNDTVGHTWVVEASFDDEFPGENETGYAGSVQIETQKLAM